jgi:stage II sporulation protein M
MKLKRKKGAFKKQARESLNYFRESRQFIYAVILIFLASALFGVIFSNNLGFIDKYLKEIVDKVSGLSVGGLILFILQNNIQSAFFGLLLGIVLGIFPVITSIVNGVIIGYVMKGVWLNSGFGDFWRILPHGVFELPAVFISLALGLRLGMFIFSNEKRKELVYRLKNSLVIFFMIVLPLLIVAAIIEGILIMLYK